MGPFARDHILAISVVLAILSSILGGSVVAFASHQFTDVDDGAFFHDSIGAIVGSGCAVGYPDGTFRPDTRPTRGQFAYWTNNCGGRIIFTESEGDISLGLIQVAAVTIKGGAQPSAFAGSGFVLIEADYELIGIKSNGCRANFRLEQGGFLLEETVLRLGSHTSQDNGSASQVVEVAGGDSVTARVKVQELGSFCGSSKPVYEVSLTAMYFPFDGQGNGGGEAAPIELAPEPTAG